MPKQFDTLLYFLENPGRLIDKDELLAAIWPGRIAEESSLTQTIFLLRRVLAANDTETYIVTLPGRGYRFVATVAPVPAGVDAGTTQSESLPTAQAFPGRGRRMALSVLLGHVRSWRFRQARLSVAIGAATALAIILLSLPVLRRSPRPAEHVAFTPPPHSVAVLAFTNMSGDPAQDYFSEGLTEELINSLSTVEQIRVSARMSAFSFKGRNVSIGEIARKLNVGAVLEGAVRRDGQHIRITAQLIDARTGYQVWSRSFDRTLGDVLALQTEIASAVAGSLEVTLLDDQVGRLTAGGTNNPQAFDAYLHGSSLYRFHDKASLYAALAFFEQAIQFDPGFANAYAGRAKTLITLDVLLEDFKGAKQHAVLSNALADANRAVALAPESGLPHAARGDALLWLLDMRGAEAEVNRAQQLDPGNLMVERTYAHVQDYLGHRAQAEAAARQLVAIDPLTSTEYYQLAMILMDSRKYEAGLAELRRYQALGDVNPERTTYVIAHIYEQEGKPLQALRLCTGDCANDYWPLISTAQWQLGHFVQAKAILAKAQAASGDDGAVGYALVYATWGDSASALHWLDIAYQNRSWMLAEVRNGNAFDTIRDTPQFKAIEQKMGFPPS